MRKSKNILWILFFLIVVFSYNKSFAESNYLIGPGDVLDISVWKNESLTKLVPVLPDGNITFPLIALAEL